MLSTALHDQFHAAVRDADTRLHHTATTFGLPEIVSDDPWLTDQVARLIRACAANTVRMCPHLLGGPRVIYAALWAPDVLACEHCTRLLAIDDAEDTTCDRCRQRCPAISPHLIVFGPILLSFGLCPACAITHTTRKDQP